jgi:hypothetical protein
MTTVNQNLIPLDQEFFFWGCGEPTQYGLYNPVVDRLVFVSDNYDILEYVVFLMSSKIRLLIVPLHTAPNFKIDLIDNTCCSNWSITNWPENALNFKIAIPRLKNYFVFDECGELIEMPKKDLTEVQNFIFLSYWVIKFFKFTNNCFSENYQYRIFSNLIDLPFADIEYTKLKELERHCYREIYFSTDYTSTKETVKCLYNLATELI